MIVGIGVDVVEIERLHRLYTRYPRRLADRLLSNAERDEFERAVDPARLLAKRFAVKEAAGKALGTGIGQGVRFGDLSLTHLPSGAPQLHLDSRAREIADDLGASRYHVSLADERQSVVAFVLLEKRAS